MLRKRSLNWLTVHNKMLSCIILMEGGKFKIFPANTSHSTTLMWHTRIAGAVKHVQFQMTNGPGAAYAYFGFLNQWVFFDVYRKEVFFLMLFAVALIMFIFGNTLKFFSDSYSITFTWHVLQVILYAVSKVVAHKFAFSPVLRSFRWLFWILVANQMTAWSRMAKATCLTLWNLLSIGIWDDAVASKS